MLNFAIIFFLGVVVGLIGAIVVIVMNPPRFF